MAGLTFFFSRVIEESLILFIIISLTNWVVAGVVCMIDCYIIGAYVLRKLHQSRTDNNPVNLDVLRENDNPKNPVPTVVERRFVGENRENEDNGNDRENYSIETETRNNNDIDGIIPTETQTGNDDDIILEILDQKS
jgi:uncharacterized protein YneF (UPF0154 family)